MNNRVKKIILKGLIFISLTIFICLGIFFYANWKIPYNTKVFLYENTDSIPASKVALVLGTSKYLRGGYPNPFFTNRIEAAKELYQSGKVKAFVLSGDNGHYTYNEPRDMKKALVKAGVPDSIIYLDYAGFRTLDSVVRMNKVFGQDTFIVVSQKFHNERAIFLAQQYGLTVYGYNAKDVASSKASARTMFREKFARVKVFLDIITDKQPKFLGEPINISVNTTPIPQSNDK